MNCTTCDKEPELETCARCREVLKVDLAKIVRGMERIYLSESNRNKKGRPIKITNKQTLFNIKQACKFGSVSKKVLAKKYRVSVRTIYNIARKPVGKFKI